MVNLIPYYQVSHSDNDNGWQGTHCWGFVRLFLFEEAGVEISDYQKDNKDLFSQACEKAHSEYINVSYGDKALFDLILFKLTSEIPVHTGVYIGNGKFIHMYGKRGVCVMRLSHPSWYSRIVGIYRHKELQCK